MARVSFQFDDKKFYSPTRIAEILAINKCTVYRMVNNIEDPLPAVRLKRNGQLRVNGKDLNEYMSSHEVDPVNE